jgi:hypothetical protein
MFGCKLEQVQLLGQDLDRMNAKWRELVVATDGFLPFEGRIGLNRQQVAWGDQDSMVRRSKDALMVSY